MKELVAEIFVNRVKEVYVKDGKVVSALEVKDPKQYKLMPVYDIKRYDKGVELKALPEEEWAVKENRVEMTHEKAEAEIKPIEREAR